MSQTEIEPKAEAEAGDKKAGRSQSLLKLIAGLVFVMVSVGALIYRMPKHHYVDVIPDKPRPRALAKAEETPSALAKVQPQKPPPPRAGRALKKPPAGEEAEPAESWRDACAAEIGILCNNVPESRQPGCLRRYDEAIRKDCLKALLVL